MGDYVDYFKPTTVMSLCAFLTAKEHMWSSTGAEGTYTKYTHSLPHYGGSEENAAPASGRDFISFWGAGLSSEMGGCCHATPNDATAWQQSFIMDIRRGNWYAPEPDN